MQTWSLLHWLLAGNIALVVVLSTALVSVWRQQKYESRRLDNTLRLVQQAQTALINSTLGMGQRIKQIDSKVQSTERRIVLPQADEAMMAQATRLVQLGASASDLVDSCGVPRGEAELLVSLQRNNQYAPLTH